MYVQIDIDRYICIYMYTYIYIYSSIVPNFFQSFGGIEITHRLRAIWCVVESEILFPLYSSSKHVFIRVNVCLCV